MGWLRTPCIPRLVSLFSRMCRLFVSPIKSTECYSALIKSTTMQGLGPISKQKIHGKIKTVLWCLKSAQGLNLIRKNPELSFARKSLPSVCLAAHFAKGILLAPHHNFGAQGWPHGPGSQSYTPHKKNLLFLALYPT